MASIIAAANVSWPSADELTKVKEIKQCCSAELARLPDQSARDVTGDLRVARFLRFHSGDVAKASGAYKDFLNWRVQEGLDALRKGVIDLEPEDFLSWIDQIRSPFAPPANLHLGEAEGGHIIIFAMPGLFKAVDFVHQRPACHTLDTDFLIICLILEWLLKRLDDKSYTAQKMLYLLKVVDMRNLGKERLPILVPEIRRFAKTNVPIIMSHYCEQDLLIMVVNAPFVFRIVFAFASTLLAKRQLARVKVWTDVNAAEPQAILKSLAPASVWPRLIGGTREHIPLVSPLAYDDPACISKWLARTEPGVVRGQAPTYTPTTAEPGDGCEAAEGAKMADVIPSPGADYSPPVAETVPAIETKVAPASGCPLCAGS